LFQFLGRRAGRAADVTATPVLVRDVIPTIEVFDVATSGTSLMMPFAAVGFNPQPEPPTPMQ
jgi:hypothetical protein